MKYTILLLFFFCIKTVLSNSILNHNKTKYNFDIDTLAFQFVNDLVNQTYLKAKNNLNETCQNAFEVSINDEHKLYTMKLYRDSAKNKNDLGSYSDCFALDYRADDNTSTSMIRDNITYLIVHIQKEKDWFNMTDVRFEMGNFIFGLCLVKGCSNSEYEIIIDSLNNVTGLFPNTTRDDITIFNWGDNYLLYYNIALIYNMIPIYIIFILVLMSCFPYFSIKFFMCCFRKKKVESLENESDYDSKIIKKRFGENEDNISVKSIKVNNKNKYDQNKLNKLINCFNLNENAEEILSTNISIYNVNINDDSGLSIVKGLRGMNMIFSIPGYVFKILFNSPIKIFSNITFRELVMGSSFSFILLGLRFGPRIFFAISGYCLIYKLLCYFDNEVDKLEKKFNEAAILKIKNNFNEKNIENNTENSKNLNTNNENILTNENLVTNKIIYDTTLTFVDGGGENKLNSKSENYLNFNSKQSKSLFLQNFTRERIDSKSKLISNQNNFSNTKLISYQSHSYYSYLIPFSSLIYFISLQSYKYFLYLLAIITFKFSYYNFIGALYSPGPIWLYLREIIIETFKFKHMLSIILLSSNFTKDSSYDYDMFWIASNEIFYFLIFTFLIFIFYKKNWRFDIFIIISFVFFILLKLGLFLYIFYFNDQKFLPALSFQKNYFQFILKNPMYNMPCFLVGLFFGSVNYCIQKSITTENFKDINKNFLKIPCQFRSFYRKNQSLKVFITTLIFGVLFIITLIGYMIIYDNFFKEDHFMSEFNENIFVNIFFLIDVDFGVLFIFLFLIPLFLSGDNFVISFFKHEYWNFMARPYFIFILILNMITLYVFYQSESRVKLELFNIIFFSLLVLMILMILNAVAYILLEVPLKKLNKFLLAELREKIENKNEILTEENNISQIEENEFEDKIK